MAVKRMKIKQKEVSLFIAKTEDTSRMRVLEFFIENRGLDFSRQDAIESKSMVRGTFTPAFEKLLTQGYIIKTRKIGRKTQLYALNQIADYVKFHIAIYDSAINESLSRFLPKKTVVKEKIEYDDVSNLLAEMIYKENTFFKPKGNVFVA
jgi:hypothetical protein